MFAGSKAHATARGLQPPACCGYPAMWWMAKRLHRVISARVVAKWGILIERGVGGNRSRAKTCQRSINYLLSGCYSPTWDSERRQSFTSCRIQPPLNTPETSRRSVRRSDVLHGWPDRRGSGRIPHWSGCWSERLARRFCADPWA